jgi:hypothetical protein
MHIKIAMENRKLVTVYGNRAASNIAAIRKAKPHLPLPGPALKTKKAPRPCAIILPAPVDKAALEPVQARFLQPSILKLNNILIFSDLG